jgi:hypothetical protein
VIRKLVTLITALALSFTVAACDEEPPETSKSVQAQKAAAAAASLSFTENAEIDNIKRRLELTSSPGAVGFVVLLNQAGQPILYTGVKGKITSSGKRLTSPQQNVKARCGEFCSEALGDGPSDEGTYGSSDPYIFFWDTNGVYHQWSGSYLYSDKPIRLRVEPLVINAL